MKEERERKGHLAVSQRHTGRRRYLSTFWATVQNITLLQRHIISFLSTSSRSGIGMKTHNEALADECEALNSIYGDETVVVSSTDSGGDVAILKLPNLPFSFRIAISASYPDKPPLLQGTQSTGTEGRGEAETVVSILHEVLNRVYQAGQVCLFDLVEEAGPLLSKHAYGSPQDSTEGPEDSSMPANAGIKADSLTPEPASTIPPPAWTASEPLTFNKSTFVARVCQVSSMADVSDAISHLLASNKKVATATHNIKGWRFKADNAAGISQDYDDDGETAAGGRMLHLMQLMDVSNVLVVVTRWFGGVKLGPDRFRIINNVARDALICGGFAKGEEKPNRINKSKK